MDTYSQFENMKDNTKHPKYAIWLCNSYLTTTINSAIKELCD